MNASFSQSLDSSDGEGGSSERKPLIFVSYSREDQEAVRRIYEALTKEGFSLWMDESGVHAGEPWNDLLQEKIENCSVFMPVMSESIKKIRGVVHQEWDLAWKLHNKTHRERRNFYFVPVVLGTPAISRTDEMLNHVFNILDRVQLPVNGATAGPAFEKLKRSLHRSLKGIRAIDAGNTPPTTTLPNFEDVYVSLGGRAPANLALRWALNRRAGGLVVVEKAYGRLRGALMACEQALLEAPDPRPWPVRQWLEIQLAEVPALHGEDPSKWVEALARAGSWNEDQATALKQGKSRLGVLLEVSDGSPDSVLLSTITRLAKTREWHSLIVVQTTAESKVQDWTRRLQKAFDCQDGLGVEAMLALPSESGRNSDCDCQPSSQRLFGPSFSNLHIFCVKIFANGKGPRPAGSLLEVARSQMSAGAEQEVLNEPWPAMHALVEELARESDCGTLAKLVFALLDQDKREGMKIELVKALAQSGVVALELVAGELAQRQPVLRSAWLEGLPLPKLKLLPENLFVREPQAVLVTLLRSMLIQHNATDGMQDLIDKWLVYASPELQEAARGLTQNQTAPDGKFWKSRKPDETLRWLALLTIGDPRLQIPFNELGPEWFGQAAFWQLVMSRPLEPLLLGQLVKLPPEQRAVLGLCQDEEWTQMALLHQLPAHLLKRGRSCLPPRHPPPL